MRSAGNDIVALGLVDKQRSHDSRFYSKILSPAEIAYYRQPACAGMAFDTFLWLCWSVKESAYKFLKRNQPDYVFSPSQIIVCYIGLAVSTLPVCEGEHGRGYSRKENRYAGRLTAGGTVYYFHSRIFVDLITTVVSDSESFEHVYWGYGSVADTSPVSQSIAVRSLILQKLATLLPGKKLRIRKPPAGYPVVMEGESELDLPVSLAHHGGFVGYSFLLWENH